MPDTALRDKMFGLVMVDKSINLFYKKTKWCGRYMKFKFSRDSDVIMQDCLSSARLLFINQVSWDSRVKKYAFSQLNDKCNSICYAEKEELISYETFDSYLDLVSIRLFYNGEFEFLFMCDMLFEGKDVIVKGNLDGKFYYAIAE